MNPISSALASIRHAILPMAGPATGAATPSAAVTPPGQPSGPAPAGVAQAGAGAQIIGPPGSDPVLVRLLAINDFHGQLGDSDAMSGNTAIGGAATLAAYINRERAANPAGTVLVSSGDAMGASPPESSLLDHESTMAVLTQMGVDVATFGNHEWDRGFNETMRLVFGGRRRKKSKSGKVVPTGPTWPGSPFPFVSANIVDVKSGKPIAPPYVIKVVNGVKVAFIGAVTANLKNVTMASGIPNIKAIDPATAINGYVQQLKAQGIKTIVVTIHEGGEQDEKTGELTGDIVDVVKRLDPEVDAVLSAHSHKKYVGRVDGRIVVQAQSYAKALAEVDLVVDRKTGDVLKSDGRIIANDEKGIAPDPATDALVRKFKRAVAPRTERILSVLPGPVMRTPSKAGESAMGTLIAEAQRQFADADIAFMNPGGIRQDLTAGGPITWGKLFSVQPFANRVQRLEMTGRQVRAVLEQMFPAGEGTHPTILQIAGMRVTYDMSKPVGKRIVKVVTDDGKALDMKKIYRVAANAFIVGGGDGFTEFAKARKITDIGDDLEALSAYLQSGSPVPLTPIGRLNIVGGSLPADAH